MINNNVLVCDFDGTLIDKNSEETFLQFLIEKHLIGWPRYILAALSMPVNHVSRWLGGNDVLRTWSAFRSEEDIQRLFKRFFKENNTIKVNKETLRLVKDFAGTRVLLTGSNQQLVEGLLTKLGLSGLFDVVIGADISKIGFFVSRHPYGKSKERFLDGDCAVGLGNEYADRFFLSHCTTAYAVYPDNKLERYAAEKGWIVLKERKQ